MATASTENQDKQVEFQIHKIFTQDMSFESPNAPALFKTEWKPESNLDLNTKVNKLDGASYLVELNLTVTTKSGDKTAFLVEIKQSGIFSIKGVAENEMGPILESYCPTILFPYAREAISSLVARGGFPELNLAPVNFDAIYAQKLQAQQKENASQ